MKKCDPAVLLQQLNSKKSKAVNIFVNYLKEMPEQTWNA